MNILAHHEVLLIAQAVLGVGVAGIGATTFSAWSHLRRRLGFDRINLPPEGESE